METSTARIMEALALYGPGPLAPEDDPLDGDRDFAGAMAGLLNHLADALTNSALETHTEDIAWGLVNLFHRKVMRLERDLDGLEIECQGLAASQDGSEVRSVEL
ncbi:MAG: hypothetical protein KAH44_14265, partial [Oricola sp.]|nr:hypothetical protein [Oricola sp.]